MFTYCQIKIKAYRYGHLIGIPVNVVCLLIARWRLAYRYGHLIGFPVNVVWLLIAKWRLAYRYGHLIGSEAKLECFIKTFVGGTPHTCKIGIH